MPNQSFPGPIGALLLSEMRSISWSTPVIKAIEEASLAFATHIGLTRTRNEDRVIVARIRRTDGEPLFVLAVCDGVGSSKEGAEAANIALAYLVEFLAASNSRQPLVQLIGAAIKGMDEAVRTLLLGNGSTTATVIIGTSRDYAAINIGDSRLFSWDSGDGLQQISVDDTIENELANLRVVDPSALFELGLKGSLSQAIGQPDRTAADLRLRIFTSGLHEKGVVLATDGAWKGSVDAFSAIAKNAQASIDLVRRSVTASTWLGGRDNVSVIAVYDFSKLQHWLDSISNSAGDMGAVTVWIADQKIVISSRERVVQEKPVKKTRKSVTRSKNKKKKVVSQGNQLPLPDANATPRRISRRVEISTDDD